MAFTTMTIRSAVSRGCQLTVFKIGCPCLSLIPGSANVVYPPLDSAIAARLDKKSVLNDAHSFQTGFQYIRCIIPR